jgi:hypothetical protein
MPYRRIGAVLAVALLSLFLSGGLYIYERNRQTTPWFATTDLQKRFTASLFPIGMPAAGRAEQTGLARSPRLIGWVDAIVGKSKERTVIEGWVIDTTYWDQSPVVLAFFDHQFVGSTVPDSARPDVVRELRLSEKWSSPRVGFSLELPTSCPAASLIEILIISEHRYATIGNPMIKPDCSGAAQ